MNLLCGNVIYFVVMSLNVPRVQKKKKKKKKKEKIEKNRKWDFSTEKSGRGNTQFILLHPKINTEFNLI